jgi:hypothetical protein
MMRTIVVRDENRLQFYYDLRDHIWIYVRLPILDSAGALLQPCDANRISRNFIFDTGAQNSIVSKRRAKELGCDRLLVQERVSAGGIGGGLLYCLRVILPEVTLVDKLIVHNQPILIPEDESVNINVLGQDILKPYSYYVLNFRRANQAIKL